MTIRDYWIKEIGNIEEFKALGDTEDIELQLLEAEIADLLDDQFIATATVDGIAKREVMLGIQPYGDDTLATRRFRVGLQWDTLGPYTYRKLEERLTELVGANGYSLNLVHANYTLDVLINLGVQRQLQDAEELIKELTPANIIVTVSLRYNRHEDLSTVTHAYLAAFTHEQIRSEVVL